MATNRHHTENPDRKLGTSTARHHESDKQIPFSIPDKTANWPASKMGNAPNRNVDGVKKIKIHPAGNV